MRAVARFPIDGCSFFLPRAVAAVPEELEKQIFPWIEKNLESFRDQTYEQDIAGVAFLTALRTMRKIILQDATVIRSKYPDHPLFQHPIFTAHCKIHGPSMMKNKTEGQKERTPGESNQGYLKYHCQHVLHRARQFTRELMNDQSSLVPVSRVSIRWNLSDAVAQLE